MAPSGPRDPGGSLKDGGPAGVGPSLGPERDLEALGQGLGRVLVLGRALLRLLQQGSWREAAALVERRGEMIRELGSSRPGGPLCFLPGAPAAGLEALQAVVEELRRLDEDCLEALEAALAEVESQMALVRRARRMARGYRGLGRSSPRLVDRYR